MKVFLVFSAASIFMSSFAVSQMAHMHDDVADSRPVPLVHGLGNSSHKIRTDSAEAQRFFNQGLDYIWAFNHDEARRSFQKAADLDPSAAMPLWGVALAVGPNYNDTDIGHTRAQQAIAALNKAHELAATPEEHAYINALSTRYSGTGENIAIDAPQYAEAMKALATKYPDDLDAATLYAESLMDLNPWKLWSPDGTPAPYTNEIVATLQGVLKKNSHHIGANHLLIHATESSPHPEVALVSAKFLEDAAPTAGHLVHMPAHTYQRTGNFDGAAQANERAVAADRAYFKAQHLENVANVYDSMYYTHNMHFLANSCSMEGRNACAQQAAKQLIDHVVPEIKEMPMIEWYTPTQPWMLVRFQQWKTILSSPMPSPELKTLTAFWHYARGNAYAALHQLPEAHKERDALAQATAALPSDAIPDFLNPAKSAYQLALDVLDARILEAEGQLPKAIEVWKKAVTLNDTFTYNEPSDWYYPVRESLGGAYLRNHQPAEAEAVFAQDLKINPGNGRSLFGLWQAQLAQKKPEAAQSEKTFNDAWKHADSKLSVASL